MKFELNDYFVGGDGPDDGGEVPGGGLHHAAVRSSGTNHISYRYCCC